MDDEIITQLRENTASMLTNQRNIQDKLKTIQLDLKEQEGRLRRTEQYLLPISIIIATILGFILRGTLYG